MKFWAYLSMTAILLSAILLPVTPAAASKPQEISGTVFPVEQVIVDQRVADGNIIVVVNVVASVLGDIEGTLTVTHHNVFHPNGRFNSHTEGILAGTLLGELEGTFSYTGNASGEWTFVGGNPVPTFVAGNNVVLGTSGDVLGYQGVGTFEGPNWRARFHIHP